MTFFNMEYGFLERSWPAPYDETQRGLSEVSCRNAGSCPRIPFIREIQYRSELTL